MRGGTSAIERAMILSAVTGLRAAMGPALLAASRGRRERQALALAAMGELVVDKLPLVPSRASLPLMLPRALAAAWVTKQVLEEEGEPADPWTIALGAAVAAGVATLAPRVRGLLGHLTNLPDPILGLGEDYLAVRYGGEAVGLSLDDLKHTAMESIDEARHEYLPALQSVGAGSM